LNRVGAIPPKPSTENTKSNPLKIKRSLESYDQRLRFEINPTDDRTFDVVPESLGRGKSFSKFIFELGDEAYIQRITDDWEIDLDTSTINLTTFTGGLIDGLTLEADRWYLFWAFMDSNFEFAGLGVSRKPFSTFTSGSTASKGATFAFTVPGSGNNRGFQFTIGARVVVRNQNAGVIPAPQYEWNHGEVTAVTNTSVTVALDNNTNYGVDITTTAANGEILQWDSFRPYVVTGSTQTLYETYYCLLGEMELNSSSNILRNYKVSEPFRYFTNTSPSIYNSTSTVTNSIVHSGRYTPLWLQSIGLITLYSNTVASNALSINTNNRFYALTRTQVANVQNSSSISLLPTAFYGRFDITTSANTSQCILTLNGYEVPGGMRG
jgi:hypothetical protein